MSSQTQNFKIGPCSITYKGELLGITNSSSTLSFNFVYYDVKVNKTHDQVLEKRLTGMQITFKTEILEVDKGLDFIFDGNNTLTLDELGKRMSQEGGELLIVPINPNDKTAYRLPNAIVVNNSDCSFNTNEEYGLKLEFEANYNDGEEILIQRLDADSLERASVDNISIDSRELERAMTAFIAGKMNMTVDTDIFRGGIPVNVDGCAVAISDKEEQNIAGGKHYEITVMFIDTNRDKVMKTIHDLSNEFPIYGQNLTLDSTGTTLVKAMLAQKSNYDTTITDDGKLKSLGNLIIKIII
jgi:hypothetical protein